MNPIDAAGSYGPEVADRLIAEALPPYPHDLVISTKAGVKRGPDRSCPPLARRSCVPTWKATSGV